MNEEFVAGLKTGVVVFVVVLFVVWVIAGVVFWALEDECEKGR